MFLFIYYFFVDTNVYRNSPKKAKNACKNCENKQENVPKYIRITFFADTGTVTAFKRHIFD